MCATGDLLTKGVVRALSDEEGLLDPSMAALSWFAEPLSDAAVDAVITELLQLEPGGGTYKNRFAVVTDFGRLLYVVGGVYGVSTPAQQSTFFRSEDEPPHEPYDLHYMMLLLRRTGHVVTDMDATVDITGYDYLTIRPVSSIRDTSSTSTLSALMTGMCADEQAAPASSDAATTATCIVVGTEVCDMTVGVEASDISLGCGMTVDARPTHVKQLPPWDNVATVQPFVIGATAEECAVEERADEQATSSSSDAETSASTATYMRRGHPTFMEQQLPSLDTVGKVQPFLIGITTDMCAVEERVGEQAAASLSNVATSASAATYIAASTVSCDMTVGTSTTFLMPSPANTTSITDQVTVKTDFPAYATAYATRLPLRG